MKLRAIKRFFKIGHIFIMEYIAYMALSVVILAVFTLFIFALRGTPVFDPILKILTLPNHIYVNLIAKELDILILYMLGVLMLEIIIKLVSRKLPSNINFKYIKILLGIISLVGFVRFTIEIKSIPLSLGFFIFVAWCYYNYYQIMQSIVQEKNDIGW